MYISGSSFHQPIQHIAQIFSGAVIYIALKLPDLLFLLLLLLFSDQNCPQDSWSFIFPLSSAKTNPFHHKALRQLIRCPDSCHDRCTGWCYILSILTSQCQTDSVSSHNIRYRRYRYRKDAMLTMNGSTAFIQYWNDHVINIQIIKADCYGYDIHDRIHSSHLMKVHLLQRGSMSLRLRFSKHCENAKGRLISPRCQVCLCQDLTDLFHTTMSVRMHMFSTTMRVCMHMFHMIISVQICHIMVMILMLFIQQHIKIAHIQPRFFHPADLNVKALHRQACKSMS